MMKVLGIVTGAAVLLAACGRTEVPRPEEVRPVRTLTVAAVPGLDVVELAGEVRARYETRLSFRVAGKLVERMVEAGSSVKAGQPLARLDASDYALAAASARSQVGALEVERDLAEADLKRFRELRDRNFISQAEFDRRAAALKGAEARLASARAQERQAAHQADYATLTADVPGVITAVEAEAGQVVAPGQTVFRVARMDPRQSRQRSLEIAVAVPETQRQFVQRAVEVKLSLSAQPGRTWGGRLREISPNADPATRTYAARIAVLDPGEAMELGMSSKVSFASRDSGSRIELPISALYSRGDTPQVFLIRDDGTVELRSVKTAGMTAERVIIESGLATGEVVVSAGAQLLRPGQRVKVLPAQ